MRVLLSVALACLAGCNYAPSTSITTTSLAGSAALESEVRTQAPGSATFECVRSASGRCEFAVFTSACNTSGDSKTVTCTAHVVDRFALARGESRKLDGLPPDVRHCVAGDRTPAVPGCLD